MRDARIRFVPKKVGTGWRVYDTRTASYPIQRPDLGVVAQDHATEADAQKEADRIEALIRNKDAR